MQCLKPTILLHICSHSKGFDHSLLVSCHVLVILDLTAPTTLAYAVANTCAATTYGCCPDGKTPAAGPHQAGCPGKELAHTQWYNFYSGRFLHGTDVPVYSLFNVQVFSALSSQESAIMTGGKRKRKYISCKRIHIVILVHS